MENLIVHGAMDCRQNSFKLVCAVTLAPARVPSQWPLTWNVTSVTSVANDRGDNEMIQGAVHKTPCIYFKAEENLK